MIKEETIQKFKDVIESEYNIVLGIDDARSILSGLVNFYDLLAKIDHRQKSKDQGSLASPL